MKLRLGDRVDAYPDWEDGQMLSGYIRGIAHGDPPMYEVQLDDDALAVWFAAHEVKPEGWEPDVPDAPLGYDAWNTGLPTTALID